MPLLVLNIRKEKKKSIRQNRVINKIMVIFGVQ